MLAPHLILVRHGQSTWNASERLQGQADPPLSELGRAEARALTHVLARFPADRVVCSDLQRARETAALIGHPDAVPDARWREIDVGEWQGRPLADFPSGPEPSWRGGPLVPPGGESWPEMVARVGGAVDELLARGGPWLVVCHGGVVRSAVVHLAEVDSQRLSGPANGSVTVLVGGAVPALASYAWTPDGTVPGLDLSSS
jgi:broad specificity phosphatase PhoE